MVVYTRMMGSSYRCRANLSIFPSFALPYFTSASSSRTRRKIIEAMKLYKLKPCVTYSNRHSMSNTSNAKKANLSAMRKERIKLPIDDYAVGYHIGELFSHPSGIQAILNTGTLQRFQLIDSDTNTYRCTLPKIKLFNFQVAPVLDLRITPTNKDCKLELLSFKYRYIHSTLHLPANISC